MIDLKFSVPCLQCPNISVMTNINIVYSNNVPFTTTGYISCSHQDICKMYDPKAEVMDPIKKKWLFIEQVSSKERKES